MSREKSEAVVLRGVDFSETSRIVTFLTPDRGRITCIAKGARRRNSALGGVLDTFNRLELVYYWKDGREVQNLAEASVINDYRALKTDYERSAWSAFPLELVLKTAAENAPSQELYAIFVRGLESMNRAPESPSWHCSWQTLHLLSETGFAPELEICVVCGAVPGGRAGFSGEGGVTCREHLRGRSMAAGVLEALRQLRDSPEVCPPTPDSATVREVFRLLRWFSAEQLETGFRSVRVLDELFGSTEYGGPEG